MKLLSRTKRSLHPAIPLAWLGLAVWGTLAMISESNQPGPVGSPPSRWPQASKIPRPSAMPALVMFVHPNCACSKDSLGELAVLMARCRGRVNTQVFFLSPSGDPTNWIQSELWRDAAAIPGVIVASDAGGREARLFGAESSGEVVLYDGDGRLRFQGGLTITREQMGDSPGCAALQALIARQPSKLTQTPVFGCRLFNGGPASKN